MTDLNRPGTAAGDGALRRSPNRLLAAMPPEALSYLAQEARPVALDQGQVLFEAGAGIDRLYFPHTGVVSFVAVMRDGRVAETFAVGREGFVGGGGLLGERTAVGRSVVQIAGEGSCIPLSHMEAALRRYPEACAILQRYNRAAIMHSFQTTACNSVHPAAERCSRWLLSAHDRVDGDSFAITQEALANILGVTRAVVGQAAGALQRDGVIRYARGRLTIADRPRLEARSCECYGIMRQAIERLLPETYA